ncbi:MAG: hypothetical protein CSB48_01405 [Proteobacteria bacterium]|nr:MAG: hypothetical protein CSB48_01405 [Pseudomonadota bacterium]
MDLPLYQQCSKLIVGSLLVETSARVNIIFFKRLSLGFCQVFSILRYRKQNEKGTFFYYWSIMA